MDFKRTKFIVNTVVFFVLFFLSLDVSAGRKIASIRQPPPGWNGQTVVSAKEREAINEALLEAFVESYRSIQSFDDVDRLFVQQFPKKEQAEIRAQMKQVGSIPKLWRQGNVLAFVQGNDVIRVRWDNVLEPRVNINGIEWVFNPRKPLVYQLGLLVRKAELASKSKSSAALKLLLPDAHAVAPVAAAAAAAPGVIATLQNLSMLKWVGGAVGAVVMGMVASEDVRCVILEKTGMTNILTGACAGWLQNKKVLLEKDLAKAAKSETVKDKVEATKEGRASWAPVAVKNCPVPGDANNKLFIAEMQEFKPQVGGKINIVGRPFIVRQEHLPDGFPKETWILRKNSDPNDPSARDKAMNVIVYDKETIKEVLVPSKFNGDGPRDVITRSSLVPIDIKSDDLSIDPETRAARERVKLLVKSINDSVSACMTSQQIDRLLAQEAEAEKKSSAPRTAPPKNAFENVAADQNAPSAPEAAKPAAPTAPAKTVN